MKSLQELLASDWGSIRIGNKVYSVRLFVTVAGAALWFGSMLVKTGTAGIVSIWTSFLFLGPLVAIGSATRTVTLRQLISLCFLGGFMMGAAVIVINAVMPTTITRNVMVPPLEETFKIAPVLFLLWRWRVGRLWTLAATDVLLLAAASGTGFGVVEDAYIRHRFGWPAHLDWLPIVQMTGGRVIAGHAIWTALAGATIGLALLFRSRRILALLLGVSGFALAIFDHVADNLGAYEGSRNPNTLASIMNRIGAHGYLVLYLFLVVALVVLAADLYVVSVALPDLPELKPPSRWLGFRAKWSFSLPKRAFAHAVFQYRQSTGPGRAEAICSAMQLDAWFQKIHFLDAQAPSPPAAAKAV